MKRVLITGATGLIGKESIQPLIKEGFEVFAVTSKADFKDSNANWIEADLLNLKVVEEIFEKVKPEYLLHFAWVASGDYLTSEKNFDWLNSSLKMLEEFKKNGGKRAVFAGTCFEYGFKDTPLEEEDPLNPETIYAKCKNELRKKAEDYCKNNRIAFGWGRIFYVLGHGENEKRLVPYIINSLKSNKEVLIKHGNLIKDYTYTKDVAGAFVKFLCSNVEGCVNICSGKPISIKEFSTKIAVKLGKENLLKFEDEETSQPKIILGDNKKLLKAVGYELQYELDEAIENILK